MHTENEQKLRALVARTKIFLLDMDGTIYLGETPIGDMKNTLAAIRASGRKIVYCTNNSSKTANEYVRKLERIGLFGDGDTVYTSGMATAEYLREKYPDASVYLVGTDAVRAEFSAGGVRLCDEDADIAVLAYDTQLTYAKLVRINRMIVEGKLYIATHPDDVCPAEGVYPPDGGSFIRLLACSSGKMPDVICGKPYTIMGERLAARLHVSPDAITMVGDRPHTDIRFGNNNGFGTLLVLSGETDAAKAAAVPASDRPEAIARSLNDIVCFL